MAETADNSDATVQGTFVFEDLQGYALNVAIERIDRTGERHEVERRGDAISLEVAHVGTRSVVELSVDGRDPRRYHFDDLVEHFRANPEYVVPKNVWAPWRPVFACVSGHVTVCTPIWWLNELVRPELAILRNAGVGAATRIANTGLKAQRENALFPRRCRSVCDGRVSVYVQTCCCVWFDPPVIIDRICEIIGCGPWHVPPPIDPEQLVDPRPIDPVAHRALVDRSLRAAIREDPNIPAPDQFIDLYRHYSALTTMGLDRQIAYIKAHPSLRWLCCDCTVRKVAEVPLQEDGSFDACFLRPWRPHGCTMRVVYVVEQASTNGMKVIYDGLIAHESFGFDEDPTLHARATARGCDRDDGIGEVGVFLNRIGSTTASRLVRSSHQTGELGFSAPASGDGLVNAGANVWGGTLALRYSFHKGMKGVGASFYRLRVQEIDPAGAAVGSPYDFDDGNKWQKLVGTSLVSTSIGPMTVNTVSHLYEIPYEADGWDLNSSSFHAYVDTTLLKRNTRYLFVLDVFDNNGTRLVPATAGAPGAGEAPAAFQFLRSVPTSNSLVDDLVDVPHHALANLFLVDNTQATARFLGLRQTGIGVTNVGTGCQYLTGRSTDEVQLRYEAHHGAGWLSNVDMSATEGIGGMATSLLVNSAVDTGAPPAMELTPAKTFALLLGTDPKCSFAATMRVETRHTNGSGPVTNLWAYDTAAFALEIAP